MADTATHLPTLISIVGVDGSGKSTLGGWLIEELERRGRRPVLVWSRFRNYLSKPLLALTRLTGHNYYRTIDGVRFGFHDFERLYGYRELFALLQAIDVNIAAYSRIQRRRQAADIVVCERGPWDTLVDVTADTGLAWLPGSRLGAAYGGFMRRDARVLLISRNYRNIVQTRPELVHDGKLELRMGLYEQLACEQGWDVIDNNGSLDSARRGILAALGLPEAGAAASDQGAV